MEGPKLRIVLLARREGDWWRDLPRQTTGDVESLLANAKSRKISALIPSSLDERQQAFWAAVKGFSKILNLQIPRDLYIPDLSDASFERVLYLHMIAYLALSGEKIETVEEALRQTLSHEERFWGQQDRALRQALESAVAAVTLLGGIFTSQKFRALLDRALPPFSPEPQVLALQDRLQDLYRGSAGHFLEPLQPDLLGEQLVMEALLHDNGLLGRVLDGATPEEGYSILTVLTRLAQRRPDQRRWIEEGLHDRLESLAEAAVNIAIRVGDPIGQILAAELRLHASKELIIRLQQLFTQDQYLYSVPLREVALFTLESLSRETWCT